MQKQRFITTIKSVIERKKLKSLISFHSVNKTDNYNRGGVKEGKKRKRKNIQKNHRASQNRVTNVFLELLLSGSHSPPHLPRMASNTVLVSGPAVGAARILIWSYSCMLLPPMSTAIRTSMFSFVGALNVLLSIPQTQGLPC